MLSSLIVEDHGPTRSALAEIMERLGYATSAAASFQEARQELARTTPTVVLLDIYLPDGSGIDLLLEMPVPRPQVLLMSGDATMHRAVQEMSLKTLHFLQKPVTPESLRKVLDVVRRQSPTPPTATLRPAVGGLVGDSPELREVLRLVEKVAPSDFPVYIEGESGTGKELIAKSIHLQSSRKDAPFVAVNCGAMPESLIDSEIFGHERGAFTGATAPKPGVFEQADGGTLFLDEIAEMPAELQVRLLRVLETARVKRVGGTREIEVDVRVIAATNRVAEQAVAEGKLREDLFHRLAVFPIHIPPLRARVADIEPIARYLFEGVAEIEGKTKAIAPDVFDALRRYHWPGNVRQLRNAIQRAYIVAEDSITIDCLPREVRAESGGTLADRAEERMQLKVGMTVADAERRLIEATLEDHGGDKRAAAEVLGISTRTLYNRLREYGAASRSTADR